MMILLSPPIRLFTNLVTATTTIILFVLTSSIIAVEFHAGIQLSESNFESLTQNGLWFIEHFSPFCGHCKKFAPTWIKLVDAIKPFESRGLQMGQIDCIAQGDLCVKLAVDFYPQMKLFENGVFIESYSGQRTLDAIQTYLDSKSADFRLRNPLPLDTLLPSPAPQPSTSQPARTSSDTKPVEQLNVRPAAPTDSPTRPHAENRVIPNQAGILISLDHRNWENYTSAGPTIGPTFVKYYAPWCGHCRKLAPTWKDLGGLLIRQVNVAEFDCDDPVNKPICRRESIQAYPTLMFYQDGTKVAYLGPRTLSAMQTFAQKAVAAAGANDISPDGLVKVMQTEEVFFLFLYTTFTPTEEIVAVQSAAKSFLGTAVVFKSNSAELFGQFGLPQRVAQLLVFKDFSADPWASLEVRSALSPGREALTKDVQDWISANSLPLLPELSGMNYEQVFKRKDKKLVVLVCLSGMGNEDEKPTARSVALKDQVKIWARQWRKSQHARGVTVPVDWVWLNADRWSDWLYNYYGVRLPRPASDPRHSSSIIIIDPAGHLYYERQANGVKISWEPSSVFQTLLAIEMGKVSGKLSGGFLDKNLWRLHRLLYGTLMVVSNHYVWFTILVVGTLVIFYRGLKVRRSRRISGLNHCHGSCSPRMRGTGGSLLPSMGHPSGGGGVGKVGFGQVFGLGISGGGGNGIGGVGGGATKVD